jgi:hypothetical protein
LLPSPKHVTGVIIGLLSSAKKTAAHREFKLSEYARSSARFAAAAMND